MLMRFFRSFEVWDCRSSRDETRGSCFLALGLQFSPELMRMRITGNYLLVGV